MSLADDRRRSAHGTAVDLVLLDLGLPDLEGRVVCQELRARGSVPIIVVTARSDEFDRVMLLELGADDYVVKPFGFRELVARMRAVLRRVEHRRRDLVVEDHGRERSRSTNGRRARLVRGSAASCSHRRSTTCSSASPADAGAVRSREQLIREVWDENWWGSTKTLDVHVASLRKKLRPELIETVRTVGYRIVDRTHRAANDETTPRRLPLVTVIVLLILEVPLAVFYGQRERERFTADVEHDASVLATLYEDSLGEAADPPTPYQPSSTPGRTGARVVVVDSDGISEVDTAEPVPRDFSTRPEIVTALERDHARSAPARRRRSNTDLLYVADPGRVRRHRPRGRASHTRHQRRRQPDPSVLARARRRRCRRPRRDGRRRIGDRQVDHSPDPAGCNGVATRFAGGDLTIDDRATRRPAELQALADTMSTMATPSLRGARPPSGSSSPMPPTSSAPR